VNGNKIGSRKAGETPEQGQKRPYLQVDLKDGDEIKTGETVSGSKKRDVGSETSY
jgi:hypothetical protein